MIGGLRTFGAVFVSGVVAVCGAVMSQSAQAAAEITVLSGGAVEPGVRSAIAAFEKTTGHVVRVEFNTAPEIRKRVLAGESWDVVIAPPAVIDELTKAGRVVKGGQSVGRVGLGVTVRQDAPVPDVSTVDALKAAVLAADSIVFNRASTGQYFEGLLKKLNLYHQIEKKITRYPDGAAVLEHVLNGKGREIGFGAITEILLYRGKGLRLVGPLPADVQNYTTYVATQMTGRSAAGPAEALINYLGSTDGRTLFAAAGIE